MSSFLDWFYGLPVFINALIIFSISFFFIFIYLKLSGKFTTPSKKTNTFYATLIIIIPIAFSVYLIFLPYYTGYGYSKGFDKIMVKDNYIWVIDTKTLYGEDQNTDYIRLNIVDASKGERINRKIIGSDAHTLIQKINKTAFVSSDSYHRFYKAYLTDFPMAENTIKITNSFLEKKFFPETGINDVFILHDQPVLKISDKTGHQHFVDLIELKLLPHLDENQLSENPGLQVNDYHISLNHYALMQLSGELRRKLHIISTTQKPEIKSGFVNIDSLKAEEEKNAIATDFLDGKFLTASISKDFVLIYSYETTDKKVFMLTCLDFKGGKKWEISSKYLSKKGFNSKTLKLNAIECENDILLGLNGELFRISGMDGKIKWRLRL